jgi:hypothetical protein
MPCRLSKPLPSKNTLVPGLNPSRRTSKLGTSQSRSDFLDSVDSSLVGGVLALSLLPEVLVDSHELGLYRQY